MRHVHLVPLVILSLVVAGCGGGGKSAQNSLAEGRTALDRLVSGKDDPTPDRLDSILRLFRQALRENPDSPLAHFGAAVCLVARVGWDVDGHLAGHSAPGGGGGMPPSPPGRSGGPKRPDRVGDLPPTPPDYPGSPDPLPPHYSLALFWQLDDGLANPFMLLHVLAPIADLRLGIVPFYGYPFDEPSRRMAMVARLQEALGHLSKVEEHPDFEAELPGQEGEPSFKVGIPEVQVFAAYVHGLIARISLSLAYHRDPGDYYPPLPPLVSIQDDSDSGGGGIDPFNPYPAMDKDGDGRLTPAEYLPPDPFLTLRDRGHLLLAQASMLAVVKKAEQGIEGVLKRASDAAYLLPNRPPISELLTKVREQTLPLLRQAATGPFEVDVPIYLPMPLEVLGGKLVRPGIGGQQVFVQRSSDPEDPPDPPGQVDVRVKINLAAWFEQPPADLKVLAPTLVLEASGWPDPDKTTYPDPTFAGLFPDGLPPALLF